MGKEENKKKGIRIFRNLLHPLKPPQRDLKSYSQPPAGMSYEDREKFIRYLDTSYNSLHNLGMQLIAIMVKGDCLPADNPMTAEVQEQMQENLHEILCVMDNDLIFRTEGEKLEALMKEYLEDARRLLEMAKEGTPASDQKHSLLRRALLLDRRSDQA